MNIKISRANTQKNQWSIYFRKNFNMDCGLKQSKMRQQREKKDTQKKLELESIQ